MDTSLTTMTSVVTSIVGVGSQLVTFITANPILLIPFGFGLLGGGIALVQRFKR